MAFYPKQRGTTEQIFDIGAGTGKYPFTLDASGFTSAHQWVLPDSDGSSGDTLTTNGLGILSWAAGSSGSPNLDGGIATSIYVAAPIINGGGA